MKQICFSFDDGRLDTYIYAFPVLKKFNYSATINVISNFVTKPNLSKKSSFLSSENKFINVLQLADLSVNNWEIACHGQNHKNTVEDVKNNIEDFKSLGFDISNLGFASPGSYICHGNLGDYKSLFKDGYIKYIRSGIQVKREGLLYSLLSFLDSKIHSPLLFYILNKKNIINGKVDNNFYSSVTIYSYTTNKQVEYLIKKMNDKQTVILMFHSILEKNQSGYGRDKWFWDLNKFSCLIDFIHRENIKVSTNREINDDIINNK